MSVLRARPSRASPHMRKSVPSQIRQMVGNTSHRSHNKSHRARNQDEEEIDKNETTLDLEEDEMATTFVQYCASCDKQMVVPHSIKLYCSDTCRKMDTSPAYSRFPPPASFGTPFNAQHSYTNISDSFGFPPESRLPSIDSRSTRDSDARIPPANHNGKADIDPTEWKPAEAGGADRDRVARVDSEKKAARVMPSLSSTATASSVSSENLSPTSTPYLPTSPGPNISGHTASITDATSLGIEDLNLCYEGAPVYEKRLPLWGKRSNAARGSLKQLLEQGKRD